MQNTHEVAELVAGITEYRMRIDAILQTVSWLKLKDPGIAEHLINYIPEIHKLKIEAQERLEKIKAPA